MKKVKIAVADSIYANNAIHGGSLARIYAILLIMNFRL